MNIPADGCEVNVTVVNKKIPEKPVITKKPEISEKPEIPKTGDRTKLWIPLLVMIISGISGIGKSTLMKLLLGVIHPEEGKIYLEMQNGEKVFAGKHIRQLFSYVPQGNLLMSGTIKDTVSMIGENISEEEIEKAAEVACAADFIKQLPNGLETVIGEKGAGLSEGQVQRLAVMRAVLSKAPIILLDEATSALDEETEEKLLANIKNLKNKTCILISLKKAAYSICEKELKIEDKKIYLNKIGDEQNEG